MKTKEFIKSILIVSLTGICLVTASLISHSLYDSFGQKEEYSTTIQNQDNTSYYKNPLKLLTFTESSVVLESERSLNLEDYAIRKKGTKRIFNLTGLIQKNIPTNIQLPSNFISKGKNDIELVKLEVIDVKRDYP